MGELIEFPMDRVRRSEEIFVSMDYCDGLVHVFDGCLVAASAERTNGYPITRLNPMALVCMPSTILRHLPETGPLRGWFGGA